MEYTLIEYLCLFFVYGFLGWCAEVIFAAVNQGRFVNRGFLFGPICPIYGLGMLAVIAALEPLKDNIPVLYFGSVAITTRLELLVGILAEKLFHQRLWDYTDEHFNFKGYICLKFSLMWGVGAMMIVCIIHPFIIRGIRLMPDWLMWTLAGAFSAMIIADCVLTLLEAAKIPRRIKALQEMERLMTEISAGIGGNLTDGALKMRDGQEKMEKRRAETRAKFENYRKMLDDRTNLASKRLMNAFPHLDRSGYRQRMENVKKRYDEFMENLRRDRK